MLEPLTNQILIGPLLGLLFVALVTDIRDRVIPNVLVVAGLVIGVAGHSWFSGTAGLVFATLGACVGLLCLLPFYLSGAMGAGDVKLMALCGAFLGPVHIVVAAVVTLVAGGVLGTVWLFFWRNSSGPDCLRNNTNSDSVNSAIPYALAITAGAVTSLIAAPAIVLTLGRGVS